MNDSLPPLDPDASFRFGCSPEIACFNECCRDLNQFLTPYDVLRLKNRLGLQSGLFLARHTRRHTGPGTGLPVVTLAPADPERLTCPFVAPSGCRVYPDRPSSCRTYPLVRILRRPRESDGILEEYRLLMEPHCRGFEAARQQTVREWITNQGLADYHAENDRLLDLIALKTRLSSKALPPSIEDQVYLALYDLDRLRGCLTDGSLDLTGLPAERIEPARQDETALLRLGLDWVKQLLERTLAR